MLMRMLPDLWTAGFGLKARLGYHPLIQLRSVIKVLAAAKNDPSCNRKCVLTIYLYLFTCRKEILEYCVCGGFLFSRQLKCVIVEPVWCVFVWEHCMLHLEGILGLTGLEQEDRI